MTNSNIRPRRYDEACAATHAMNIIGERWAVPVIRELSLGPRRFSDIKRSIQGISANALTQRLSRLQEAGVVEREVLPPPASIQVYQLTPWGRETGPVLQMLGRWAVKSPDHDPSRPFSATSLVLSLRTMFDESTVENFRASIGLVIDGEDFFWTRRSVLEVGRGRALDPDLLVTGGPSGIAAVVYRGHTAAEAGISISGDKQAWSKFLACFPSPDQANGLRSV
ncbi:MAG: helix-turn-helix domain-containing protein [Pseudomonadota bacterium]